jgi:hypothetical protein
VDDSIATVDSSGSSSSSCCSSATTSSVSAGTSVGGGALERAGTDGGAGKAIPHDWQNCESASLTAWHPLQNLRSRPAPHWLQNLASDGFGRLQRKQIK